MDNHPIGFFDSGAGGLTIWRATRRLLPHESLIYLADAGHAPIGEKSPEEIRDLTTRSVRFLLGLDVKLMVIACNTATVHAIDQLRDTFPQLPFVGVVPMVKTLAEQTRTGTIAVLSTPATAASPYLAGLIDEFAPDKRVINIGCDGLEATIDTGEMGTARVKGLLERYLTPVRESKADVVGLACTHYPFLRGCIERMLGPGVRVFDPSLPVARRVRQLLAERDGLASDDAKPTYRFYSTGDPDRFATIASKLLRSPVREVGYAEI